MGNWLRHAIEHQPDAHAGGKQHREPAGVGIVGFRLGSAEPDLAERRDDQRQRQKDEDVTRRQEKPVKAGGQCRPQPAEKFTCFRRQCQRIEDQQNDAAGRDGEDRVMDIHPERADLWLHIVLADLIVCIDNICFPVGAALCYFAHNASPGTYLRRRAGFIDVKVLSGKDFRADAPLFTRSLCYLLLSHRMSESKSAQCLLCDTISIRGAQNTDQYELTWISLRRESLVGVGRSPAWLCEFRKNPGLE